VKRLGAVVHRSFLLGEKNISNLKPARSARFRVRVYNGRQGIQDKRDGNSWLMWNS
jgi:hypothetical protein